MYLPALLASLHHFAAFTLVATVAVEVATFKPPLSVRQARRLQRIDLIFGIAAASAVANFEAGARSFGKN